MDIKFFKSASTALLILNGGLGAAYTRAIVEIKTARALTEQLDARTTDLKRRVASSLVEPALLYLEFLFHSRIIEMPCTITRAARRASPQSQTGFYTSRHDLVVFKNPRWPNKASMPSIGAKAHVTSYVFLSPRTCIWTVCLYPSMTPPMPL